MAIDVKTLKLAKKYTEDYVASHGGTDEIVEYTSIDYFPRPGKVKTLYVDTSTNLAYRWSGTTYIEVSPSLALGETAATAYRGDRGKTAYDDSQINKTAIGTLANLNTLEKSSLVGAINELKAAEVVSTSVDSSGLCSFKDAQNTTLFTLQLPLYDRSVE